MRTSETWAYPARELRVALDLPRMAELRLAPGRVMQALQSENTNIPGGSIDVGSRSFSLKTSGSYETLDEVRDTVVAVADGRSVRVRDIAEVTWDTQEHTYVGRYNGKRAVFVTANQKDGYNIFEVRERVIAAAERFETQLPKRIKLELGFDQSENVAHRLDRLTTDFGIAIALVAITLLPLGLRAASVVMISIPLSLAIGLSALYFIGFSLNQISIAGLRRRARPAGRRLDRRRREHRALPARRAFAHAGRDPRDAPDLRSDRRLHGDDHVRLPAADDARRATSGKFIRVLPTAVLVTVGASLLVALTIIPFLASRIAQGARRSARQSAAAMDHRRASIASISRCCIGRWRARS